MIRISALVAPLLLMLALSGCGQASADVDAPRYTADGSLTLPADYRTWVFLSSSVDLSYSPRPAHQFDNVFAAPAAYRVFQKTGTWPDKTVLILENRGVARPAGLALSGQTQDVVVTGLEAHVKDTARFKGGWGFFAFDGGVATGAMFPYTANCYACHRANAAVDTTFVQFYPTLLPIATRHHTLSPHYVSEAAAKR